MLKNLYIHNYAIINEISIDFSPRLNVITGETGAGKSILMGALSLILGDRADTSVLLNREKKCIVEGIFSPENKTELKKVLLENDIEGEENNGDLVIRREIGVNGKSRAFVNDIPVNLELLRQVSSLLVDLHRQFDTLSLSDSASTAFAGIAHHPESSVLPGRADRIPCGPETSPKPSPRPDYRRIPAAVPRPPWRETAHRRHSAALRFRIAQKKGRDKNHASRRNSRPENVGADGAYNRRPERRQRPRRHRPPPVESIAARSGRRGESCRWPRSSKPPRRPGTDSARLFPRRSIG